MDGGSNRNQLGASGRDDERRIDPHVQVHAGSAGCCIYRRGLAHLFIGNPDVDRDYVSK